MEKRWVESLEGVEVEGQKVQWVQKNRKVGWEQ